MSSGVRDWMTSTFSRSRPKIALNVVHGMTAWLWSGSAVDAHLRLVLHHADDRERRVVHEERLPDGILLAEDVLRHLVAEEEHAALLRLVRLREEAPARLRIVLARLAVDRVRAEDAAVHGLAPVRDGRAPRHALADDGRELRHPVGHERHVVRREADRAAGRHPLPGLRRLVRPHDGEVLARGPPVSVHLPLQALAEREEEEDRDRAPGDRGDRQGRALLREPRRLREEGQDDR